MWTSLPMMGDPSEVLPELKRIISAWVDKADIGRFYIGRSTDPNARANAHNCDAYIVLYETNKVEDAMAVEDKLIKMFFKHPKLLIKH